MPYVLAGTILLVAFVLVGLSFRKYRLEQKQKEEVSQTVQKIVQRLEKDLQSNFPALFYAHCLEGGVDRMPEKSPWPQPHQHRMWIRCKQKTDISEEDQEKMKSLIRNLVINHRKSARDDSVSVRISIFLANPDLQGVD